MKRPQAAGSGHALLAPISPGLYRPVCVGEVRRIALGERIEIVGPGLLAFDGDRERALRDGQRAAIRIERDGPRVIDPSRTLRAAAMAGAYSGRAHWHDHRDDAPTHHEHSGKDCC